MDLNDILKTLACIKNVINTVVEMYVINKFVIMATDCYVWVVYFWNLAMKTIMILITAFSTIMDTAIPTLISMLMM
jgi:hypothetical protein